MGDDEEAHDERDVWVPFRFFVGAWEGAEKGKPGEGRGERDYRFVLNGKFLEVRNVSTFEPQEKNPEGEVHEDRGFISYDQNRNKFVFRQFHVEGFVNQYVLDSITRDGKTLVFITETIENIPAGWRAKETYRILNDDEFQETFELAAPGKDFEVYIENHFRRKG
ncbi:MAG: hypothetical protein V3U52_05940 [Thermoplasmata archaeon]